MPAVHGRWPTAPTTSETAWIAWGTQFILWMMIWGVLYALPYMVESKFPTGIPLLKTVLGWPIVHKLAALCQRFHTLLGWLSTVNGIGTAVYTGLVIQSFPAVALWPPVNQKHNIY